MEKLRSTYSNGNKSTEDEEKWWIDMCEEDFHRARISRRGVMAVRRREPLQEIAGDSSQWRQLLAVTTTTWSSATAEIARVVGWSSAHSTCNDSARPLPSGTCPGYPAPRSTTTDHTHCRRAEGRGGRYLPWRTFWRCPWCDRRDLVLRAALREMR